MFNLLAFCVIGISLKIYSLLLFLTTSRCTIPTPPSATIHVLWFGRFDFSVMRQIAVFYRNLKIDESFTWTAGESGLAYKEDERYVDTGDQ